MKNQPKNVGKNLYNFKVDITYTLQSADAISKTAELTNSATNILKVIKHPRSTKLPISTPDLLRFQVIDPTLAAQKLNVSISTLRRRWNALKLGQWTHRPEFTDNRNKFYSSVYEVSKNTNKCEVESNEPKDISPSNPNSQVKHRVGYFLNHHSLKNTKRLDFETENMLNLAFNIYAPKKSPR